MEAVQLGGETVPEASALTLHLPGICRPARPGSPVLARRAVPAWEALSSVVPLAAPQGLSARTATMATVTVAKPVRGQGEGGEGMLLARGRTGGPRRS